MKTSLLIFSFLFSFSSTQAQSLADFHVALGKELPPLTPRPSPQGPKPLSNKKPGAKPVTIAMKPIKPAKK